MRPARVVEGTIVLPKKIALPTAIAVVGLIVGQAFYFGYSHAVGQGRLERVERDVSAIADMRERLVRIETSVGFIRDAVEKRRP